MESNAAAAIPLVPLTELEDYVGWSGRYLSAMSLGDLREIILGTETLITLGTETLITLGTETLEDQAPAGERQAFQKQDAKALALLKRAIGEFDHVLEDAASTSHGWELLAQHVLLRDRRQLALLQAFWSAVSPGPLMHTHVRKIKHLAVRLRKVNGRDDPSDVD